MKKANVPDKKKKKKKKRIPYSQIFQFSSPFLVKYLISNCHKNLISDQNLLKLQYGIDY